MSHFHVMPRQGKSTLISSLIVATLLLLSLFGDVNGQISMTNRQPPPMCREPSDVMEMYRHLRSHVIDNPSDVYNGTATVAEIESLYRRNVQVTSLAEAKCEGYSARKCSCPQKYELNVDANRIPRLLVQASCCYRNPHRRPNWRLECRNVMHHIPVLRRTSCIHGVYKYERMWEEISVGCSCFSLPAVWS